MKRIFKGLILAFVGVLAFTLASCGEEKSEHQPQPGWYRDSSSHWHNCGHCDEQLDLAIHNYDIWVLTQGKCEETRKCKTCGYIQTRTVEHTWGEWTAQEDGSMGKECTRCGAYESVAQYYVKGDFLPTTWAASEEGKFEIDYTTMTATITVNLAVGNQFKVGTKDGWEFGFDNVSTEEGKFEATSDGNLKALEAADYEITITGLDGSDHKVSVKQLCVHTFVWTETSTACNFTGVCSKCEATGSKVEHTWGSDIICDKCNAVDIVDYYIKGNFLETQWGPADANKFTVAGDNKSSSYVISVVAGNEFKIGSKSGWEFNASNVTFNVPHFEGTDNIVVKADGVYVVTVSGLDTATHSVSIDPVKLYVRGDMNGWGTTNALVYDEATDSASLEVTVAAGQSFKVAPENWGLLDNAYNFGTGEEGYVANGGNISLEAGIYIVKVTGVCHGTPALTISEKPAGYSVTYNVHGHGTAPAALTEVTALPAELPGLSETGWTFVGWYSDEELTTAAVAGAAINANTTLYAKWVEITYSVTYDANEVAENPAVVEGVKALPATLPVLTAEGYEFLGWYTDEELTTAAVAGAAISANTTLYAKWRQIVPVEGLLAVVGTKNNEFKSVTGYLDSVRQTYLNVYVYLKADDVVTIKNADASFGYAFDDVDFVEGLFVDAEGSLKVTKEGYYNFYILNPQDSEIATCRAVLSQEKMSIADAAAAEIGTGLVVKGTVVSEENDMIVLTDGADTPSTIKVKMPGNCLPGDVIQVYGTKTADKDDSTLIYISGTLMKRDSTVAENANVILTKVESLEQLTDSTKIILTYGDYVMGDQNGKIREVIYSPNYKDNRGQVITLVKNGESWKLQVGENLYLLHNENANNIETGAYVEDNGDWTITITDGVLKIASVRNSQYHIQFNSSASALRFCAYKSAQKAVVAYVVTEYVNAETFLITEAVSSFKLGTVWNDVFILGEEGNSKTWKTTSNSKKIVNVDGETVNATHRLQSQGQNEMFINLENVEGTFLFQFFVLSGDGGDLTRTITLMNGETEVEVFTITQNDGWADKNVLNTMVYEFTVQGGSIHELVFSNGINIHGINLYKLA